MTNRRAHLSDDDLIARLRKAASVWFKNDDLLLLEELIRRHTALRRHFSELEDDLNK